MTPLWFAERTLPTFDDPDLSAHYEVAVVGAGITGLTTAVLLAELGHRVIVLEARTIGAGTTGASNAKVSLVQGTRFSSIAGKHPAETLGQYVSGNRFGMDWLLRFCAEHEVAVQRPAGITYAADAGGLGQVEREHELLTEHGLDPFWRDEDDVPFPFAGGTGLPDQAQVNPVELLAALTSAAEAAGITLATGHRVVSVGSDRDPTLATTKGEVHADRVVLATGIPIADRGGFFARVVPQRSYLSAAHLPSVGQMDMYLATGSPGWSVRTAPAQTGQWVLAGGYAHDVGYAESEAARLEDLAGWARSHFGADPAHRWSAQDYHPVDELPYVGPLTPTGRRVLVASGFAKWGLTNAPAAAAVIAGHLGGEVPDWADAYRSWHTHELSGVVSGVTHNVKVAGTLAGDRLASLRSRQEDPSEGTGCVARQGMQAVATSTVQGRTRTVSATCPHMGGLVRWNDAEQSWDCPLHGSRFTAGGDLIEGPATSGLERVDDKNGPAESGSAENRA
ncbi:FAD-dependent oxidoreductase [Pseudactinotalea sp. Z1748]|uniref:FAD-dependent oxidoreductase n=1 Tax=Pseudactinotalea sp. Z1748 TaxID=3413027 RepID=UPI003C7D6523